FYIIAQRHNWAARIVTGVLWSCELCKLESQESSHVGMCINDFTIEIWFKSC
ncbi:hypothetical protein MKW92_050931, partial [Papaver armeniacum]